MIEIRFHGRGGQGTVVATILMSKAFFRAGCEVQSFPFFGVERRGAPVEAYLRLDKGKILLRTNVYTPDHVVVLDNTLLASIDVSRGLKPRRIDPHQQRGAPSKRRCLLTIPPRLCGCQPHRLEQPDREPHPSHRQYVDDGGCFRVLEMPPLDDVLAAIRDEVPGDAEHNVTAAREAYEAVRFVEPARSAAWM